MAKAKVIMSVDDQIAALSKSKAQMVRELVGTNPKPSRKKNLEQSVSFFDNLLDSLNELKVRREGKNININIKTLIDSINIKDMIQEELTEKVTAAITEAAKNVDLS